MFSYSVKIRPINWDNSKIKAFASVLIEDVLEIPDFKVVDGANGMFVGNPSKEGKPNDSGEKTWWDTIRFLEKPEEGNKRGPVQEEIHQAILAEYERYAQSSKSDDNDSSSDTSTRRARAAKARASNQQQSSDGSMW